MNKTAALFYAVEALREQRKKLAFHANLYDKLGADIPVARNASIQRKLIEEAISVLLKMRADVKTEDNDE